MFFNYKCHYNLSTFSHTIKDIAFPKSAKREPANFIFTLFFYTDYQTVVGITQSRIKLCVYSTQLTALKNVKV